jgi:DNA repair protein RecN (Recombination protein N)
MLTQLVIQDVVLVQKLAIEIAPGFATLTGETGAGKSILLDALGLALGERSDAGLVRAGQPQASVTASFELSPAHPVFALLAEQGLLPDEDHLVLRRVVFADGKSRAFINDQPVGVGLLRQAGAMLVEIHGQFDTHGLMDAATHIHLLDAFGGLQVEAGRLKAAYARWQEAETAKQRREADVARSRDEDAYLRACLAELTTLAPQPDEAKSLAERRTLLQNAAKIGETVDAALHHLEGSNGSSHSLVAAGKLLARLSDKGLPALADALAAIDRATQEAVEAAACLNQILHDDQLDAGGLEALEDRLFTLKAVARKHGVDVDALPDLQADITRRLSLIDGQSTDLAALMKAAEKAKADYLANAKKLSDTRRKLAEKLDKAVKAELAPLKLDRAIFVTQIDRLTDGDFGPDGLDRVTFLAATNPGTPPGLLHKIASGGELARFMLALKLILAKGSPATTLIFDEIDTGIGGAVADAVGARLARLAEAVQILAVTHSPQVAARASRHWRVEKTVDKNITISTLTLLSPDDRREEIARMLSGEAITDAARQAATSLLAGPPS